jgi:hypothetical protein
MDMSRQASWGQPDSGQASNAMRRFHIIIIYKTIKSLMSRFKKLNSKREVTDWAFRSQGTLTMNVAVRLQFHDSHYNGQSTISNHQFGCNHFSASSQLQLHVYRSSRLKKAFPRQQASCFLDLLQSSPRVELTPPKYWFSSEIQGSSLSQANCTNCDNISKLSSR